MGNPPKFGLDAAVRREDHRSDRSEFARLDGSHPPDPADQPDAGLPESCVNVLRLQRIALTARKRTGVGIEEHRLIVRDGARRLRPGAGLRSPPVSRLASVFPLVSARALARPFTYEV